MKNRFFFLLLVLVVVNGYFTGYAQTTTSGIADVNGTSLYYELTGKGTPLVFIHGFTCDHRNWDPQVKFFSKKYKVITYDLRGHGKSRVPDTIPYRHDEDLIALMDYLKIEKAVIIGHSLGGLPAFFYDLNHPERVLGLVLAEGGPIINDPELISIEKLQDYFSEFSNVFTIMREQGLEKAKVAWLNINPIRTSVENPISSELIKTMINDYSGWHWQNRDPQKKYKNGVPELFGKITTPTLMISGDLSHEAIKEMVSVQDTYIPNSKKVVLKNSNHMLNIENPDQFNKELIKFLKENKIR